MEKFEVVDTEYGKVKGIHKVSALDTEYISFQGIPFMKAPLGKLRFTDAQKPEKWSHILDATEDAPCFCSRNLITDECEGQENAGTINVFTKNTKPEKLYPVMVWIYGGSFFKGSSKTDVYGPDYILEKDVIFISFNYRPGVFGFLSLEDRSLNVPGNAGLKDQIFALKWVRDNILNFGGDPSNVTLFGESAGAGCVHFLSISEQAKGLFHRAIIMSGTVFCKRWSIVPRNFCRKFADQLARKLGWTGKAGDEKDLLNFLEDADAFAAMEEVRNILGNDDEYANGVYLTFGPVIEPYRSENCLIYKDPVEMARNAWSNDIDIIFTGTSLEGVLRAFVKEEVAYYYFQDPAYFVPLLDFDLQNTDPIAKEYGERIKNLYYKENEQPSMENQNSYLHYQSDMLFWHGIYRAIHSRIKYSQHKTYLMRFHVDGSLNLFKKLFKCGKYKEASHADDLFYLFKTIHLDVPPKDSKEFAVIMKMVGMFTNFAITGNPNCSEIDPAKFTPQTNADELKCIQITENDVTEIELPELSKLKVWDSIYNDHDVPLF